MLSWVYFQEPHQDLMVNRQEKSVRSMKTVNLMKYTRYVFHNKGLVSLVKYFLRVLSHID